MIHRTFARRVLLLSLLALAGCASTPRGARYDILIAGGTIVDGTGAPARKGDVAIRGDRIVAVGNAIAPGSATRVIDARGLFVAPGFIEPHAHITGIEHDPLPENFLRQGVTTIVNSLHSLDQPYPLGAYLDTLRVAPNTVWTSGHSWLRQRFLGLDDRAPTPAELSGMATLVGEAMDDGAIGLATGLEYIPANFAKLDEIVALARAAKRPNALYITHLRDEGTGLLPSIEEAIAVGRAAGLPVHINHLKSTGLANAGQGAAALRLIEAANRSGVRTSFDVYPYDAYSTVSTVLFPSWALAGGAADYARRIDDPATRARLVREMTGIYAAQTLGTLDSVQFREVPGHPEMTGRTLRDWVKARGQPETLEAGIAALIELQRAGGFTGIFRAMSDGDIEMFLRHPLASISSDGDLVRFGEGYPHPRSYGAFPRVLGLYVRERGLLTMEQAIAKMTSVTARHLGLVDRGTLAAGRFADLVLFDPATIGDRATFALPHQYSTGITTVLVNGIAVIDSGRVTGALPGRPLRRAE